MTRIHVQILFRLLCILLIAASGPSLATATEMDVNKAQRHLLRLGYEINDADGDLGDSTRAALEQFQDRINFSVTGEISDDLLIVITHYYVNKVNVPKGALVLGIRPGKFNFVKWQSTREMYKEEIPILECTSGVTEITAEGVKCASD